MRRSRTAIYGQDWHSEMIHYVWTDWKLGHAFPSYVQAKIWSRPHYGGWFGETLDSGQPVHKTYGRASPLAHGARIFAVRRDTWQPKFWSSLHPTSKFRIMLFVFFNKIITTNIGVSNMVYWHFWLSSPGACSIQSCICTDIRIPIVQWRWCCDHLISTMGFPVSVRVHTGQRTQ